MQQTIVAIIAALSVILTRGAFGQVNQSSEESRLRIATMIPAHITNEEIARYGTLLGLTEAQGKYVQAVYSAYAGKCKDLRSEAMKEMIPLSDELARAYESGSWDPRLSALHTEFAEQEAKCRDALEQEEQSLFAAIDAVLADPQRLHMPRVRAHRDRRRCAVIEWEMYSAQVDLTALVEAMALPPEAMASIDGALIEYEQVVSPLMRDLDRTTWVNRMKVVPLVIAHQYRPDGEMWSKDSPEAAIAIDRNRQRMKSLLSPSASLQRRISDANSAFAPRLASVLPPERQQAFLDRFRRAGYPYVVYPDQSEPRIICQLLLEQFTAETRQAADELCRKNRKTYEAMNATMCALMDDRRHESALTKGVANYPAYREHITRMRDQRWALNEGLVKQLFAMLGSDAQVAVRGEYENYLRMLHGVQSRLTSREWPGY